MKVIIHEYQKAKKKLPYMRRKPKVSPPGSKRFEGCCCALKLYNGY
jgi:hypothetical protein